MMKRMPTRAVCFIACVFILIQSTSGQTGFVSIACCSGTDFKDTPISWMSDSRWYPDNSSCTYVYRAAANNAEYQVRTFHIDSGKRCYNLTTIKDQDYLIRGTFLLGDPVGLPESSFDVLIGITPIGVVDSRDVEVEGFFRASEQYVDFCLQHEQGDPYISRLELRPLDDPEYLNGNASKVLKLVSRTDLGSNGTVIRYPDDPNDRIWKSTNNSTVILSQDSELIRSNTTIPNGSTTVPVKVLQTALTHTDRLEFLHNDLDPQDYNYTLRLYFLELIGIVKPGQRQFNLYINNVRWPEQIDILDNGSNYKEVALDILANRSINVTLVKVPSTSSFGPILNAYEILQVRHWQKGTNQQDVVCMKNVRNELLQDNTDNAMIKSWSGDPCFPQPWQGLACQNNSGIPIITKLDVSLRQLHGPIPPAVTNLSNLRELNISYNKFTGQIPQFPLASVLTSVDVSHNDLTGSIPDSLFSLATLTTLYYGCNLNLSRGAPIFNSSRVSTDYGTCVIQGPRRKTQKLVISTIACGSFLVTVAIGIALVQMYRRKLMRKSMLEGKPHNMTKNAVFAIASTENFMFKSINIETYTLEDIEMATDKYKTLIGEGGFGSVYCGTLPDGQEVAVKVRSSTSTQGTREFENELNLLSTIRHENLVPLLGYSWENDQQILVYPFMSNGSLQDRLYGEASKRKTLDWPTRLSIALGAARGLTHLHTFSGRGIIHRDVKSSNILLDHSMTAKVADFGFSKYAPQEGESGASLEVRGTAGYLDPEYYSTQHLSAKSDVFSFGVVLLEIISGREPLNIHRARPEWSLVEWAKPYIRESKIDEIVDPSIKGMYHAEAMWRVVEVALACIEPFSAYRPSMEDIVRELEDALIIENNASEYMKSIDSMYSVGGSNRYSIIIDKKTVLTPPAPSPTEPSPYNTQAMAPPEPR